MSLVVVGKQTVLAMWTLFSFTSQTLWLVRRLAAGLTPHCLCVFHCVRLFLHLTEIKAGKWEQELHIFLFIVLTVCAVEPEECFNRSTFTELSNDHSEKLFFSLFLSNTFLSPRFLIIVFSLHQFLLISLNKTRPERINNPSSKFCVCLAVLLGRHHWKPKGVHDARATSAEPFQCGGAATLLWFPLSLSLPPTILQNKFIFCRLYLRFKSSTMD